MRQRQNKKIVVSAGWYIMVAAMLLLLPIKFVLCWLLSAFLHECFHLICIRACGAQVYHISVGAGGAVIETSPMDPDAEAICALAGPFSGFLLFLLIRVFPVLAICACVQTVFNLLPLYPFDGGRVLACMLLRIKNEHVSYLIELLLKWTVLTAFVFLSAIALIVGLGPVPLMCVLIILIRNWKAKIPCKAAQQIVQ